ncbi:MAG: hypothetical protein DRP57_01780 [Spirochaetes bacterium]|nr:MAG: hypothetical protein DRP57_01780 [Spirochaetota bacterium]
MRKFPLFVIFSLFLSSVLVFPVFSEISSFFTEETAHYKIYSDDSIIRAGEIAKEMEACLNVYNNIMHLDLSPLNVKLKVRIFKSKESFDTYLNSLINQTRDDFVYIHYTDLGKSELVGFEKANKADFNSSLIHQGFIQFIKALIPNAPIWLREGIAAYIENAHYNPATADFTWRPNLVWLDSLKEILKGNGNFIPLNKLLTMNKEEALKNISVFYPEAWGVVQFLSSTNNKEYNRILWDSISALTPGAALYENSEYVVKRAFSWADTDTLKKDFSEFMGSLKTFTDYVKDGIDLYSKGNLTGAEKSFKEAVKIEPDNHIPYYYMGLIAYARKKYNTAEEFYKKACKLGTETGLINYALGVNAFAANKYNTASEYLKKAKAADNKTYGSKVDTLLKRIELLR